MQYGMNNYKQKRANKGKELFITNFDINNTIKPNFKKTANKLVETSIIDFF